MDNGWKYYNHALIPATAPHESADIKSLADNPLWKDKRVLFARWTTDYDCGYETQWWYCLKDTPLDLGDLPSKKRYEINKGKKNFDVRKILPWEYGEELYRVTVDAFSGRVERVKPTVEEKSFKESITKWVEPVVVLGAFHKESNQLCGFVYLTQYSNYVDFNVMRTMQEYERLGINAALVAGICNYYHNELSSGNGFYILDGSRNIQHKTAFQDYLEKYFGFRKAYCKLNLLYRKPYGVIVALLMPFRKLLYKFDTINAIKKISGILRMEEFSRK